MQKNKTKQKRIDIIYCHHLLTWLTCRSKPVWLSFNCFWPYNESQWESKKKKKKSLTPLAFIMEEKRVFF